MMAMSVNRRIERTLPNVMGQHDPEAMIRVRSTDPIRASGLPCHNQQAGHMTASDHLRRNAKKLLPVGGHPHMTVKVTRKATGFLVSGAKQSPSSHAL